MAIAIRKPAIPSPIFGMIIFVFTEIMFFAALVSALLVIQAGTEAWAPPDNIKLSTVQTSFNALVLVLSGVFIFLAGRRVNKAEWEAAKSLCLKAVILASLFVLFQGYEWFQLIRFGMTMTSSIYGALFFLLLGSHALHAISGVFVLIWANSKMSSATLKKESFTAIQIFWYMVIGVWPVLYGLLYF